MLFAIVTTALAGAAMAAPSVTISASATSITYGQSVTLTATLSGGAPGGHVNFSTSAGDIAVIGAQTTVQHVVPIADLSVGVHNFRVTYYDGNNVYSESSGWGGGINVTVSASSTNPSIISSLQPSTVAPGGTSKLVLAISNPNSNALTAFRSSTVYLPSSLSGYSASTTCASVAPYLYNFGSWSYTIYGTLNANETCSISLRFTAPASAGTVSVPVFSTSSDQTGAISAASSVTLTVGGSPPTITSVSPASGPMGGGSSVTITGVNLLGVSGVTIGGAAATVGTNTATSIVVTTPASASAGAKDVVVTTAGGSATSAGAYTYVAAPTITSLTPSNGPAAGGTSVTITGADFTGATAVKFGSANATSFTVSSATSITATSPAGSGAVDVTVTTAGGTSATSTASKFAYAVNPTLSVALSPTTVAANGAFTLQYTFSNPNAFKTTTLAVDPPSAAWPAGLAFVGSTKICSLIGVGNPSLFYYVIGELNANETCTVSINFAAPATGGVIAIPVGPFRSNDGPILGAKTLNLTVTAPAPTITAVSPASGPLGGGATVTITGTNLASATGVTIGGAAATVGTNTATSIVVTTPASASAGAKDVVVTTAGGSATNAGAYTYVAAPTITSLTPDKGPAGASTPVTIKGANLTGATVVFGVNTVAGPVISSDGTTITLNAPVGSPGAVGVSATTAGGVATSTFTYLGVDATLSNLTTSAGAVRRPSRPPRPPTRSRSPTRRPPSRSRRR